MRFDWFDGIGAIIDNRGVSIKQKIDRYMGNEFQALKGGKRVIGERRIGFLWKRKSKWQRRRRT